MFCICTGSLICLWSDAGLGLVWWLVPSTVGVVFVWVIVCVVYVGLIVACLRLFGCLLFIRALCGMIRCSGAWYWFVGFVML